MRKCLQDRRLKWFGRPERMKKSAWFSKSRMIYMNEEKVEKESNRKI